MIEKQFKSGLVAGVEGHHWLLVSLVPDGVGDLLIDPAALLAAVRRCWAPSQWLSSRRTTPGTGPKSERRRLLLSGSPSAAMWLGADLHHDGAGLTAVAVPIEHFHRLGLRGGSANGAVCGYWQAPCRADRLRGRPISRSGVSGLGGRGTFASSRSGHSRV